MFYFYGAKIILFSLTTKPQGIFFYFFLHGCLDYCSLVFRSPLLFRTAKIRIFYDITKPQDKKVTYRYKKKGT